MSWGYSWCVERGPATFLMVVIAKRVGTESADDCRLARKLPDGATNDRSLLATRKLMTIHSINRALSNSICGIMAFYHDLDIAQLSESCPKNRLC